MARRRYLMAYDIADPRRLRRICTLMQDHGERLQYSVFLCDLTLAERSELEGAVTAVMVLREDSVVEIDLGPVSSPAAVRCLGRPRALPDTALAPGSRVDNPHDDLVPLRRIPVTMTGPIEAADAASAPRHPALIPVTTTGPH